MTAETFWAVRGELYERKSGTDDPTYWCRGCGTELDTKGGHLEDCPVSWFEATFYEPEFRGTVRPWV